MNRREEILGIIRRHPGITGYQLHKELADQSGIAGLFGRDSIWVAMFGPSIGGMYLTLWTLEHDGEVRSEWGVATPERGGHRPCHYYVVERTA